MQQLTTMKEAEKLDRHDREAQHKKTEEMHKRELDELKRALSESADQRVAQGNEMKHRTSCRYYIRMVRG